MKATVIETNEVAGIETTEIELGENETMYIYYDQLKKETPHIIAYGHKGNTIYVERFTKSGNIMDIKLNNILLFNVDYRIE